MNQTYRDRFESSADIAAMRDAGNPTFAPLQPVLDVIGRGINYAGRVVQNPELFPGLPAELAATIREASSRAFISGMDRAFIISGTAIILCSVVAWFMIRDEVAEPAQVETEERIEDLAFEPSVAD